MAVSGWLPFASIWSIPHTSTAALFGGIGGSKNQKKYRREISSPVSCSMKKKEIKKNTPERRCERMLSGVQRGTRPDFQPSLKWFMVSASHSAARLELAVYTAAFFPRRNLTLARGPPECEAVGSHRVPLPDWHLQTWHTNAFSSQNNTDCFYARFLAFLVLVSYQWNTEPAHRYPIPGYMRLKESNRKAKTCVFFLFWKGKYSVSGGLSHFGAMWIRAFSFFSTSVDSVCLDLEAQIRSRGIAFVKWLCGSDGLVLFCPWAVDLSICLLRLQTNAAGFAQSKQTFIVVAGSAPF